MNECSEYFGSILSEFVEHESSNYVWSVRNFTNGFCQAFLHHRLLTIKADLKTQKEPWRLVELDLPFMRTWSENIPKVFVTCHFLKNVKPFSET